MIKLYVIGEEIENCADYNLTIKPALNRISK